MKQGHFPEDFRKYAKAYRLGTMGVREICKQLDCTTYTFYKWLDEAGIERTGRRFSYNIIERSK